MFCCCAGSYDLLHCCCFATILQVKAVFGSGKNKVARSWMFCCCAGSYELLHCCTPSPARIA
jgi:hypothetical protein